MGAAWKSEPIRSVISRAVSWGLGYLLHQSFAGSTRAFGTMINASSSRHRERDAPANELDTCRVRIGIHQYKSCLVHG
jgi:hypothetical protein